MIASYIRGYSQGLERWQRFLSGTGYKAFISYSHADIKIARRLHRRWENFRIDKDLIGKPTPRGAVPDNLRPIFRDRADFNPGGSLTEATRDALERSSALVLLASPDAAHSRYVDAEIELFRQLHPDRPIIPLILSGAPKDGPGQCFPPSVPAETLAADWQKDGRELASDKIIASLLGLPPDLVFQRAARQRRARRFAQVAAALVIGVSLSGAGYWWTVSFHQQSDLAEKQKRLDEVAALVRKYAPAGSARVGAPDAAGQLTEALTAIAEGAAVDPRYAQALQLLKAGKSTEAEPLLRAAAERMEDRAKQNNKRAAEAWRNLGAVAGLRDPKRALEAYARAISLDPDNADALAWSAYLEFESGNLPAAERDYRQLLSLSTTSGDDRTIAQSKFGLGDIARARGSLLNALQFYRDGQAIFDRLAKSDPRSAEWQRDLSVSFDRVGNVLVAQGDLPEALKSYRDGLAIADRLAKSNPGNAELQRNLSLSIYKVGNVLVAQGNLPEALKSYQTGLAIVDRLAKSELGQRGLAAQSDGVVRRNRSCVSRAREPARGVEIVPRRPGDR